ncbi:MAG: hypothetical protein ACJ764_06515 [Solirubrobacteraceae bacterium]
MKRSPVNLRPMLGIRPDLSVVTLAHAISAYAQNGFLPDAVARAKLVTCFQKLMGLRINSFSEPCWGYHFDVQTRVFFYPRTTPNTIASAFAGLAMLDAFERTGLEEAVHVANGVADFFVRHVPQTPDGVGSYFGYLPGDATPIHNANTLVSALLVRLARLTDRADLAEIAAAGFTYTAHRQRDDGSWPYGERPGLSWVDGFHTGYVLDCLLDFIETGWADADIADAWERGFDYYATHLVEPGGLPRYTPTRRFPVDGQCAAQAIQTLSRGAERSPSLAERRWAVFRYSMEHLSRPDGAFTFQRERYWSNRAAHPRWVEAPMLHALTHLIASEQ